MSKFLQIKTFLFIAFAVLALVAFSYMVYSRTTEACSEAQQCQQSVKPDGTLFLDLFTSPFVSSIRQN